MKPEGGSNANILLQFNLIEEDDEEEERVGPPVRKLHSIHFVQVQATSNSPVDPKWRMILHSYQKITTDHSLRLQPAVMHDVNGH